MEKMQTDYERDLKKNEKRIKELEKKLEEATGSSAQQQADAD